MVLILCLVSWRKTPVSSATETAYKVRPAALDVSPPQPALLSVAPEAITTQVVDQPVLELQPTTSAEDPEKLAESISLLSESEVRDWLGKLSTQDLIADTGRLLIRRWSELDPAAAVYFVMQVSDASTRQELVDVVAVAWSENDLPNALTWVKSLPEGDAKHQALTDVGFEVARIDPICAMQIVTQMPTSDYSDSLLLHALAQYASANPEQSQQLALSLPRSPFREQALSTVATVTAEKDGAQAAQFAVKNIFPGPEFDRAVIGIVQSWGRNSFNDATAWVLSFPNSPIRDHAVQSLGVIERH